MDPINLSLMVVPLLGIIFGGAALVLFFSYMFRRVVPTNMAHVVVQRNRMSVYSSLQEINQTGQATYYYIPYWVPYFGMYVLRMPLENLEVHIPNYITFTKNNARIQCSVSVYMRILDVKKAAQRFPSGDINQFLMRIKELVVAAIRNTTTEFNAEDVIAKKNEIAERVQMALDRDLQEWGVHVINAAVVDIGDPPGTTVIQDISAKKEAEINAESRKMIAVKVKEAEIIEYENMERAETRKWQMDEAIRSREQQKEQKVQLEAQKAMAERMKVVETQMVRQAEIDRQARIAIAEGERQAIALAGKGEAEAITAKGDAIGSAKQAEAKGLNAIAEAGKSFRLIEKDEKIGLAIAGALTKADLKFVNAGPIESFLDILSPKGGAQVGAMMEALKATNPGLYKRITDELVAATGGDKQPPELEK